MAPELSRPIRTRRIVRVAAGPAAVWTALARVEDYRSWWPGLVELKARELAEGERWRTTVRAPLGYLVRFELDLTQVMPGRSVAAAISGDIVGFARISTEASAGGTDLTLAADLAGASMLLRFLMAAAPPVARLGHDRIIDAAFRQFDAALC